jgi:hypothetical protein
VCWCQPRKKSTRHKRPTRKQKEALKADAIKLLVNTSMKIEKKEKAAAKNKLQALMDKIKQ